MKIEWVKSRGSHSRSRDSERRSISTFIQYVDPEPTPGGMVEESPQCRDKPLPPLPKDNAGPVEQDLFSDEYIRPPPKAHIPTDIRRSENYSM